LVATDKEGGIGTDSKSVSVTSSPAGTSASFALSDVTTQGNWRGVYGADGYALADNGTSLPAYARLSISGAASWTWAAATADPRAPQDPIDAGRRASCWYSGASFTYDLELTDGATHRVGLYAVDWDQDNSRAQRVEVIDAATSTVLDARDLANFTGGQYLAWDLRGHVQIRITHLGGANAVVGGLFFDLAAGPSPTIVASAPEDLASSLSSTSVYSTAVEQVSDPTNSDSHNIDGQSSKVMRSKPKKAVFVFARPSISNVRIVRRRVLNELEP
jgi:hypothetical protein